MLVVLVRNPQSSNGCTRGKLYFQETYVCDTIEPPYEGNDICQKGCIPFGFYNIVVTRSPKFNRDLPWVQRVTGFSGIRIHAGSNVQHTRGCILVPKDKEADITRKLALCEKNAQNFILVTDTNRIRQQLQNGAKYYLN